MNWDRRLTRIERVANLRNKLELTNEDMARLREHLVHKLPSRDHKYKYKAYNTEEVKQCISHMCSWEVIQKAEHYWDLDRRVLMGKHAELAKGIWGLLVSEKK